MLNRDKRRQRQRVVAIVACAAAAIAMPLSVAAQIPVFGVDAVNLSQPVTRIVQELLELDAQRALDEEKRKAHIATSGGGQFGAPGQPAVRDVTQNTDPAPVVAPLRLVAITGVGRQLTVTVDQAGRRAHYRTGQPEPVAGPDLGLRLQTVSQPCASFVDPSQDVVTYCLNRGTP